MMLPLVAVFVLVFWYCQIRISFTFNEMRLLTWLSSTSDQDLLLPLLPGEPANEYGGLVIWPVSVEAARRATIVGKLVGVG